MENPVFRPGVLLGFLLSVSLGTLGCSGGGSASTPDDPPPYDGPTVAGRFVLSQASMNKVRMTHQSTCLEDGTVLILGGIEPYASAELYNPNNDTFTSLGLISGMTTVETATRLLGGPDKGKVLITPYDGYENAKLYDPRTRTFVDAGRMVAYRPRCSATDLGDGRVLLAGGIEPFPSDPTAEIYDPNTRTFSATVGQMAASGRIDHVATLLPNGKVLLIGGSVGGSGLANAELYDPSQGTFRATAGNMTCHSGDVSIANLDNGNVLVVGGLSQSTDAELYDYQVDHFSRTGSTLYQWTGSVLCVATSLLGGQKVLLTGENLPSDLNEGHGLAELYDRTTGSFSKAGRTNKSRVGHAATLMMNGKVLITGGNGEATAEWFELQ